MGSKRGEVAHRFFPIGAVLRPADGSWNAIIILKGQQKQPILSTTFFFVGAVNRLKIQIETKMYFREYRVLETVSLITH